MDRLLEGLIVPSSIQRVRAFLVEMCGLKVKPWASTEEMLAALHTMLVARHRCDMFWTSLRVLLETLARDLKTRQEATLGALVDNEVLDGNRYTALLDEIKACLAGQGGNSANGSFRALASGLSGPALGLLLLLGGTVTVGCDRTPLPVQRPDAAMVADASKAEGPSDASTGFVLPPAPDVPPATYSKPDVAPPHDAVAVGPDGATVTIKDIMDSCNISSEEQSSVLACLSDLRDSWSTGLAQELAGASCSTVDNRLNAFSCWNPPCQSSRGSTVDEFSQGSAPYCLPVIIYMGVRFV
jgi:hypothetical protein